MPTKFAGTEEERRALDLFIKLSRASESVAGQISKAMGPSGVTVSQFGVLDALYHLGPLPLGELAKKHLRSPNNMTTVIDTMEKHGWVERQRCPGDRRIVKAVLTCDGRALFESLWPANLAAIVSAMSVLTPAKQLELAALVRELGLGQ